MRFKGNYFDFVVACPNMLQNNAPRWICMHWAGLTPPMPQKNPPQNLPKHNASVTGVHDCILVDLHFDNFLQFPRYFGMPLQNAKQLHIWETRLAIGVRAKSEKSSSAKGSRRVQAQASLTPYYCFWRSGGWLREGKVALAAEMGTERGKGRYAWGLVNSLL